MNDIVRIRRTPLREEFGIVEDLRDAVHVRRLVALPWLCEQTVQTAVPVVLDVELDVPDIRSSSEYKHLKPSLEGGREICIPELSVLRPTISCDSVDFGFTFRDCLI